MPARRRERAEKKKPQICQPSPLLTCSCERTEMRNSDAVRVRRDFRRDHIPPFARLPDKKQRRLQRNRRLGEAPESIRV